MEKKMLEKEKMLVISIFFCHNVFKSQLFQGCDNIIVWMSFLRLVILSFIQKGSGLDLSLDKKNQ